jgi:hypothetical protein
MPKLVAEQPQSTLSTINSRVFVIGDVSQKPMACLALIEHGF